MGEAKTPDSDRKLVEEAWWPHHSTLTPVPVPAPAPAAPVPAPEGDKGEAPSKSSKGKKREPTDQWKITEALMRADYPQGVPDTTRTANLRRKITGKDNERWNAECKDRGISVPAPSLSSVDRVRKSLAH